MQKSSSLRRLLIAVAALAAIDRLMPSLLATVESRYESGGLYRFENSDLFAVGPLVDYLRERPQGPRPRAVFFGDSVIWGYGVQGSETLPAQFQRVEPSVRVLNLSINGLETGSSYLMAKAIIDSVDALYVLDMGGHATPKLSRLIPVDPGDVSRFEMEPPDRVERRLEALLGFWHLYAGSYRLQAGLFGMSTRQYLYTHKAELVRRVTGRSTDSHATPALVSGIEPVIGEITVDRRRADVVPDQARLKDLAHRYPVLFDFGTLVKSHGKQAMLFSLEGHAPALTNAADRQDFNAWFFPNVTFLKLGVPQRLRIDTIHLSPLGAAAVARVLAREMPPGLRIKP